MSGIAAKSSNRFQKFQRLSKPSEFQAVYKSRNWGNNNLFSFNLLKLNSDTDASKPIEATPKEVGKNKLQLGVTVSKKVSKNAVERNRIKRIVREHFRLNQNSFISTEIENDLSATNVTQNKVIQLVVTARAQAANASSGELKKALENLWQKIEKAARKL